MKTKILSLIISLFLIFDTFGMEVSVGNLWYDIDGNNSTAKVVYYREYVNSVNVIIPSTITYNGRVYKVTSIDENAFNSCSNLKSIEIPNSVTSIGDYAFRGCSSLSSITIPNGVTTIGSYTFSNCSALKFINMPNNVWAINHYAFHGCSSLSSLIIPNGVRFIGSGAFLGCTSLTQLIIPSGVTEIQERTFENCTSLKSVSLPNQITVIGETAFYNCSSLMSIEVPNSVISIGYYAFKGCSSLTSFTIPNQMTVIEESLFSGCTALNSIFISNSVTTIKKKAFENCISLFSIVIPENVTSIGENVFQGCSKLTSIIWNAISYSDDISWENGIFDVVKEQITSFVFGERVRLIPSYLCKGMNKLSSVLIPENVTSIGVGVFVDCSSLSSVQWNAKYGPHFSKVEEATFYRVTQQIKSFVFGDSVESIPPYLCCGMNQLTSICIPNCTNTIWDGAFQYCSSLDSITIPCNVQYIGEKVFKSCSNLTSVKWNAKSCKDGGMGDNGPFFDICEQITSFVLGDSVQRIPDVLCYGMKNLRSFSIPASVTSIGSCAFCCGNQLSYVEVKNTNPPILDGDLFTNLSKVVVYIPDNTFAAYKEVWIRSYHFMNNETTADIDVKIPGSLYDCILEDGKRPFNISKLKVTGRLNEDDFFCIREEMKTSLVEVDMSGISNENGLCFRDMTCLQKINLPKKLVEIEDSAFLSCNLLDSILLPTSVTKIGKMAFAGCSSISSLVIPSLVTEIGEMAFANCYSLSSFVIPSSIIKIGYGAFNYCSSILFIKCLGFTPSHADELGLNASKCTLWVPKESFKEYAKHTYWGKFLNIKTLEDGYKKVNIISINDSLGMVNSINGYYNVNDLVNIIAIPKEGCYFVKWSDGDIENPRTIVVTENVELQAEFEEDGKTFVDNVDESSVMIYVQNGVLYVEDAETDFYVLYAAGRLVYSGRESALSLPRGVYVVNVGDEVQKVVI